MESNEKKPKRPRIGQSVNLNPEQSATPTTPENGYNNSELRNSDYRPRTPYHQGPRQNGYNRPGGYNRQGGYNNHYDNSGYRPRPQYHNPVSDNNSETVSGTDGERMPQRPYQRPYQQRPYQRPYQQSGYRQNSYNNRPGGYGRYNQNNGENGEGGFRPRQNGYNNRAGGYNRYNQNNGENGEGGFQPRQNGYNNRAGGYNRNQGGYNRAGGYNRNQGGYNQGPRQNRYGMPQGGKSFVPRPKRVEYEAPVIDPNEEIRLNKYMANAGICSRREADEYIQQGLVKVNGNVVTELGTKITHKDTVEYDEKIVTLENKCYILLNKPKDCVTTSDDPNGRLTVMDLVKGACNERIYPVGRLDRNTTGVLLLTNDGDLASKLTHPKYVKKKIYHVWTDKDISEEDMQRIADGIELEDGPIHADAISYATETDRNQAGIEIHSGRNRIVRRLFESLGYHVTKLDRVYFAGLTKKNLPRGRWRYLTQEEVNFLKMGSFE